jgi:hypothetical protein
MARSVKNVKNSLKFKANVKTGVLSVRVGVRKYVVPAQARILASDDYIFLSFTASSELYKIDGKKLIPMGSGEDATDAFAKLNPGRKRRVRRVSKVAMPEEVLNALKKLPSGFRLGYDSSGKPRLIKSRTRSKKK